uniref:Uncharacterized protein n=1 Tax=Chenopodium quinoa TaxID=63459 RepID=A0A803N8F5_CHEQI
MDGLQRLAEHDLRRRGVNTLAEGIVVAESLVEVSSGSRQDRGKTVEESDHEGEDSSLQTRVKHDPYGKDKAQSKGDSRNEEGKYRKPFSCWLCGGPHMARTCPQRQKLSAIIANFGEDPIRDKAHLANMRLLNTAVVEDELPVGEAPSTNEEASTKQQGNFVFVNAEVNGGYARMLVDTNASHNLVRLKEAKDLGIKFTKVDDELMVVNIDSTLMHGRAWKVLIRLGKWKGKVDFLVVDLDDVDLVLGIEFILSVVPIKMDRDVMTITHNGCKHEIKLARGEEARARLSSMKAWWALGHKR